MRRKGARAAQLARSRHLFSSPRTDSTFTVRFAKQTETSGSFKQAAGSLVNSTKKKIKVREEK